MAACAHAPLPPSPAPPPGLASPFTGFASAHYADPKAWLCLPGRDDACASDLDATELLPDGTRAVVRDTKREGADDTDCFYVYPTVDLSLAAANHSDFTDTSAMATTTIAQAARFRSTCRLFVPLYRQATIGAYLRRPAVRDEYLSVAASDVMDAFLHYMGAFNGGRKIVLIGHSQGAEMVTRLLKRFFDDDPAMRARLVLAMPIGGGHLEVAKGQTTGGTFANIPMCSHAGETGCVIGYQSFVAGSRVDPFDSELPAPGRETVCVDPAELDANAAAPFSRAFLPVPPGTDKHGHGIDGVTTPFVMLRDFYSGRCESRPDGFRFLAVSAGPFRPGDVRVSPLDLSMRWLRGKLGLHILDLQFEQGDLVDLVARRLGR
jgi:pimeloyl-ACP methyl ester carboxylesterase